MSPTNLDPSKMQDWQIAEAAEENMISIEKIAENFGITSDELIPMGKNLAKIDQKKILSRIGSNTPGKYIDVTAITPTPLGEGKTTTTIGLVQGLGKLGKKVSAAIRQPSGGPTFNIKGSAAGGGLAQCIPLTPFSIRMTGDMDSITNAHNLAMTALTARMQHEFNYDDQRLAKSKLTRLNIDPQQIQMKWVMDFCAQALRNIRIGMGGKMDGYEMDSGFAITASSEIMAILAVASDLNDLRQRISKIVVAYSKCGKEVTTADLEVDGAMTAWLTEAINPKLMQTIEGQPILVHAGPFANIAIGQSSIIADNIATRLSEYHITESGFGADIGFEKFWNLKCRISGLTPSAVVIVATIRALKMHGGGSPVKPGMLLADEYTTENVELVEKGCENLIAHIETVKKAGITPVVCINGFYTDTDDEIKAVRRISKEAGAMVALSQHWLKGGDGAIELAETVIAACEKENNFKFLYEQNITLEEKIATVAKQIYGAIDVEYAPMAKRKLEMFQQDKTLTDLGLCMVKTHLSISHDPALKGRPTGWALPIKDILIYKGAGYFVPVSGEIKLMPGTASNPAYRNIDIDAKTQKTTGLF